MSNFKFGKLERVAVRKAWKHEAQDFTPWLADNLGLLAEELGIDLELEGTEIQVGPYRADIVAQTPDASRVLIENQLADANLRHLGQILAYMTGLNARVIVWVATGFNDIHRSAIRWLNEHTVDPFAFFAVEVSTVRIGNSEIAPVFEVLEQPNEWERKVQEISSHGELGVLSKFRREFWAHFAQRIPNAPGLWPGYAHSNVWHKIDKADVRLVQYLARDRVGVYVIGRRNESMEEFSPRIEPYVEALRKAVATEDNYSDNKNALCGVTLRIDTHNRANWDQMAAWLNDRRRRYEKILRAGPPPKP